MLPRCAFLLAHSARSAFRGAERQFAAVAAAASQVASVPSEPKTSASGANKVPRKPRPTEKYPDPVNINDAFGIVKKHAWARFDETVEAIVGLDVDPRKPNQSIKGVAQLPNGNGKKVVVAVFARDSDQKAALDAGADIVGAEDLIARVQAGDIPFQRAIATPEMMSALSKIGKVRHYLSINTFYQFFIFCLMDSFLGPKDLCLTRSLEQSPKMLLRL